MHQFSLCLSFLIRFPNLSLKSIAFSRVERTQMSQVLGPWEFYLSKRHSSWSQWRYICTVINHGALPWGEKKTLKGKQKHTLQYIMNISLLYYLLLLLASSNGKCRLISHREQHAGLMDQQWHMCSCASLVSRCVSLSLLPRCPSKPSFVSIVVVPSIRPVKKRNCNILHCRPVYLAPPPALGSHQLPPSGMGFVLPSWDRLRFVLNLVHFRGAREGIIFGGLDSLLSPGLQMHSAIGIIPNDT